MKPPLPRSDVDLDRPTEGSDPDEIATISVLLIDDDSDEHLLLRRLLRQASGTFYRLDWVGTFEEGEREIGLANHDVYLIDHRLGPRDGLELLRLARSRGCTRPVIVLTGFGDSTIERAAMEAGAADYLTKGRFDSEALDRIIRYSLQRARIQEALVDAEHRFRGAFDHAPIGMALLTAGGIIRQTNPALSRLIGYPERALVGRPVLSLIDPDADHTLRSLLGNPAAHPMGEGVVMEVALVGFAGERIETQIGLSPLRGRGSESGFVVQVVDLTDLRTAHRRLEELLAGKDEFLASVSHELRTPLTAVLGFARLLAESETVTDDTRMMAETIYTQSVDLANIVEDLLVHARVETGGLTVLPVMVDVRSQVLQVLKSGPVRTGVDVIGPEATTMADPARLRQILRNLLTNAVRYGGRNVMVEIESASDQVAVTVADDGEGLARSDWERVFEPYQSAHRTSGTTQSLGLGLAISRRLARMMGGDLTYRHEDGWSRFRLTLPRGGDTDPS